MIRSFRAGARGLRSEWCRGEQDPPASTEYGNGQGLGPSQTSAFLRRGLWNGHWYKRRDILNCKQALKAHVRSGHIVVDEPTDLPEGSELEILVVGNDALDEEDERELMACR